MRGKKKKQIPISFGHGCAVSDDIFCVASFLDDLNPDVEFTRVFILNLSSERPWMHHDIADRTIISIALRPEAGNLPRACCALSAYGELQSFNSTEVIEEEIPAKGVEKNRDNGLTFSAISYIDTKAYACGAVGRIYRRDDDGWRQVATEIFNAATQNLQSIVGLAQKDASQDILELTKKARETPNFEHISGTSESDIYACGGNGLVVHWDGKSWSNLRIPTRQHLHCIHCHSPDEVYICGHNGTLLLGNSREGFRRVALGRNDLNFWTVQKFNETVYVGTTSGLFQVEKSKIQSVALGLPELHSDFTVQALDSTKRVLWVVADKFLLRFDGGAWRKIDHPDNTL
ncbi:WD40/YVTN/BNR-like repeat-containing protein [Pseudomonas aeruginosa]